MLGLVMAPQMAQRQTLRCLDVVTDGSHALTAFPMVQKWLSFDDHRKALNFAASRKSAASYHSVMDFLLCETFPMFREPCLKWYGDCGPRFLDVVSEPERAWYEHCLLGVCVAAYDRYQRRQRASWSATTATGKAMVLSPIPED